VVHANEEFHGSWWLKEIWQFVAEKGESGVTEDVAYCGGFALCVGEVVVFCLLWLLTPTVLYFHDRLILDTWFIQSTPKANVLT
jgi:hypothetical protein